MNLELARTVADAVLYEGYLLYPYRASSAKNQSRWQFGVLGPQGAAARGVGEQASMSLQCVLTEVGGGAVITVHLRFLQLQRRQCLDDSGSEVEQLGPGLLSWDEAVEVEQVVRLCADELPAGRSTDVTVAGGTTEEPAEGGRIERRRWPLTARLDTRLIPSRGCQRLELAVTNLGQQPAVEPPVTDQTTASRGTNTGTDWAIRHSLIGAHLLIATEKACFASMLDPPAGAAEAVAGCSQHRCWPVLTGAPGDTDLMLGSPIILYDYPEIAEQSAGTLFDGTEIDEILTLRVMTMTEAEKAEARATDPHAAAIIDRCDAMPENDLARLHGILRNPHALDGGVQDPAEPSGPGGPGGDLRDLGPPSFDPEAPWWDPAVDAAVNPATDTVMVNGTAVSKGSVVRVHPSRRADAQDLFFADQLARVTAVLCDVDGSVHIALVLLEDPAADLHEGYGRYFYFAPDEIEPVPGAATGAAGVDQLLPVDGRRPADGLASAEGRRPPDGLASAEGRRPPDGPASAGDRRPADGPASAERKDIRA